VERLAAKSSTHQSGNAKFRADTASLICPPSVNALQCSFSSKPSVQRLGLRPPPVRAMDDARWTQWLFATLFSPHCSACGLTPHFLHTAQAWLRGRIINFLMSFSTLPVTTESEGWTNRTELNLLLASLGRRGWCGPHLTDVGAQENRRKKIDNYFGCLVSDTQDT